MKTMNAIVLSLLIIGAINWGCVGIFGIDLVSTVFGATSMITRIIFSLVGIAGVWAFSFFGKVDEEEHREMA